MLPQNRYNWRSCTDHTTIHFDHHFEICSHHEDSFFDVNQHHKENSHLIQKVHVLIMRRNSSIRQTYMYNQTTIADPIENQTTVTQTNITPYSSTFDSTHKLLIGQPGLLFFFLMVFLAYVTLYLIHCLQKDQCYVCGSAVCLKHKVDDVKVKKLTSMKTYENQFKLWG